MNCELRIKVLRLGFLIALFFILYSLFLPKSTFAQAASASSTSKESKPAFAVSQATQTTSYPLPTTVSPTSPLYTDLLVHNLFHSFSCLAVGQSVIGQPCLTYQMTKSAQGILQGAPVLSQTNLSGGALGTTTSIIGMLYANPPVRTADYLASVAHGLGITKTANAQGVTGSGADVLSPILTLWQTSRNISYVLIIVIFLIIGLMIIFRNKINPQTVITAQAALPGLVIGLILITFSYFLAGLISDMAFLGTNVVGYYFSAAQGKLNVPDTDPDAQAWKDQLNLSEKMKNQNVLSIVSPFTGMLNKDTISDALASIWPYLEIPNKGPLDMDPARALTILSTMMIIQLLMPFGGMLGGIGQVAVALGAGIPALANPTATAGLALSFIAMVILIYAMFKLLLRLINNYLAILFLTFTAPFQLLAAALPGRQGIATSWILNMLSNILAFPAVLAVLYFVAYLIGPTYVNQHCPQCPFKIAEFNQINNSNFVPAAYAEDNNIVGSETFPLFGGLDLSFLRFILAFGALMALPSIPDIIGRTIGRMSQAGQLIGQEIGGSYGTGQRYAGQFQQGASGFAGQIGQVTDKPGYTLDATGWRKVKGSDMPEVKRMSGATPGLASKARGWFQR